MLAPSARFPEPAMDLGRALETSILLAEKVAAARPASDALLRRCAVADFATFGMFKRAALDPTMLRPLAWGLGLGLPALGVGHTLLRDARHQGESLIRDARNQALMTAAGVGGMKALGELLKRPTPPAEHNVNVTMPESAPAQQPDLQQRLAAAMIVDDILEEAATSLDPAAKHAALVALVVHRGESVALLRGLL